MLHQLDRCRALLDRCLHAAIYGGSMVIENGVVLLLLKLTRLDYMKIGR